MATNSDSYKMIQQKIDALKRDYPSLRTKPDSYVFSALCVKANLFKNPALILNENDFEDIIVDGQYDGGVDILLTDPNSDTSDMIIAQSKFYSKISYEETLNAVSKMICFYTDMLQGHYEEVNTQVQTRFLTLNSEIGDESKIHFVFYTSAPQSGIRRDRIEKKFRERFPDTNKVDITLFFGKDIEEEIKEAESRRPTVESGKIRIDSSGNYLLYGDDSAAIVNVSAFSIKSLYAQYNNNLLARNLRYHIKGTDIDKNISETIENSPETFWFKNNGITIICDDFRIDGKEVKLKNFSIINGGQTTYVLHKSRHIDETHDLYLPCKIIRIFGETEDEKNGFTLAIAKAVNSQKPIKPVDLKANAPEQVRFGQAMREVGIFYQTKRGEEVPKQYRESFLNTSLAEVGKLCLSAIFQKPGSSRTKPSTMYDAQYYDKIFNGDQRQMAILCKDLLYINYYFKQKFQKKFDRENSLMPNAKERISLAHNSRTLCIAFVALASRYVQGNITIQDLQVVFNAARYENLSDHAVYDIFANLEGVQYIIPPRIFNDKDACDKFLDQLFYIIIDAGITNFLAANMYNPSLDATNFLKKDKNYYSSLTPQWGNISAKITDIFTNL